MATIYNRNTLEIMNIKDGDVLFIEPLDTLPNFERTIVAQGVTDDGIRYGATTTSDGHLYPFWAIKSIKREFVDQGLLTEEDIKIINS